MKGENKKQFQFYIGMKEENQKLFHSVFWGLAYCLFITLSSVCVQGLENKVPDFELNLFRSIGPVILAFPWMIKVGWNFIMIFEFNAKNYKSEYLYNENSTL